MGYLNQETSDPARKQREPAMYKISATFSIVSSKNAQNSAAQRDAYRRP
jgi:hypothetical protein